MKNFNISESLENLIYEICLWGIFYPYTLFMIYFRTNNVIKWYWLCERRRKIAIPILSGPLFLFITIGIEILLRNKFQIEILLNFSSFTKMLNVPGNFVPIIDTSVFYIALSIINAVIIEIITPGGVTKETFRPPLFSSMLIVAPLSFFSFASDIVFDRLTKLNYLNENTSVGHALIALLILIIMLILPVFYYLKSQSKLYRIASGINNWRVYAFPLLALIICGIFLSIIPAFLSGQFKDI